METRDNCKLFIDKKLLQKPVAQRLNFFQEAEVFGPTLVDGQ